jgi:hypothetical protein
MDDTRIQQLTREVLGKIQDTGDPGLTARVAELEARVAALEAAARGVAPVIRVAQVVPLAAPASMQVLSLGGGGERCVLEPDKPCTQSQACRTFGH